MKLPFISRKKFEEACRFHVTTVADYRFRIRELKTELHRRLVQIERQQEIIDNLTNGGLVVKQENVDFLKQLVKRVPDTGKVNRALEILEEERLANKEKALVKAKAKAKATATAKKAPAKKGTKKS